MNTEHLLSLIWSSAWSAMTADQMAAVKDSPCLERQAFRTNKILDANLSGIFLPSSRWPVLKGCPSLLLKIQVVLVTPKEEPQPLESCAQNYVLDEGCPSSVQKLNLATRIDPASKGFITNSNTFNQEETCKWPAYSLTISTEKNISEERYFQHWLK